jgi:hypothetical protein
MELLHGDLAWVLRRLPKSVFEMMKGRPNELSLAGGSILRVLKFYQRGYRIPLDSLGAVIARLMKPVDFDKIIGRTDQEDQLAKVLTGLLREVDPNVDPTHEAHLPAEDKIKAELPF